MTELVASEKAMGQLTNLDPPDRERMKSKLQEAAENPDHYLERLQGYNYYKVRAGDYRAIVAWDREDDRLGVLAVGHRSTVYDRHLPP
jgi:mRNA interferase RelE/StbE